MQTDKTAPIIELDPLHEAAARGDIDAIRQILKANKIGINELHSTKRITALAVACENGHFKIVQFLIKNGADVTAGGLKMRRGVLDYAAKHPKIADLLLDQIKAKVEPYQDSQQLSKLSNIEKVKIALLAYSLFNYYWSRNNQQTAATYFKIAFGITENLPDAPVNIAPLQWLAATCFLKTGQLESAEKYYKTSLLNYKKCAELQEIFVLQALQDTLFELFGVTNQNELNGGIFASLFLKNEVVKVNELIQIIPIVGRRFFSDGNMVKATCIVYFYAQIYQGIAECVEKTKVKEANTLIGEFLLELVYAFIKAKNFKAARHFLSSMKELIKIIDDLDAAFKKAIADLDKVEKIYRESEQLFTLVSLPENKTSDKYRFEFLKKCTEFPVDLCLVDFNAVVEQLKNVVHKKRSSEFAIDYAEWAALFDKFYEFALKSSDQKTAASIISILSDFIKKVFYAERVSAKISKVEYCYSIIVYINLYFKCLSFPDIQVNKESILNIPQIMIGLLNEMCEHKQFDPKVFITTTLLEKVPVFIAVIEHCLQTSHTSLQEYIALKTYLLNFFCMLQSYDKAFACARDVLSKLDEDKISDKTSFLAVLNTLLCVNIQHIEENVSTVLEKSKELMQLLTKRKQTALLKEIAPSYLTSCFKNALKCQEDRKYQIALEYYFEYLEFGYLFSAPLYSVAADNISSCLVSLATSDKADDIEALAKKMRKYVSGLYSARHYIKWPVLLGSLINTVLGIKTPDYRLKVLKALCGILEQLPGKEYAKEKVNVAYQLALLLYKQGNLQEDADEILSLLSTIRSHQELLPQKQLLQDVNGQLFAIELALAKHLQENAQPENALATYNQILEGLLRDGKKSTFDDEKTTAILQKATDLALQLAQKNEEQDNINAAICFYDEAIRNYEILKDSSNFAKAFANKQRLILKTAEQYLSKQKNLKAKAICEQILKDIQLQQASVPNGLQELNELSGAVVALLKTIDQTVKEKNQAFYNEQPKRLPINIEGEKLPRNPLSHAAKQEVSDQDQVVSASVAANNIVADKAKLNQPPRATFLGGKVGQRLQADFLGAGQGNLYPVFDKNAKDIKRLKQENPYLYKEFKRAILEGIVAHKFGQPGLKYIGFWEAKILSTSDRVVPSQEAQEDEETGAKYLVFDTYAVKGFHHS